MKKSLALFVGVVLIVLIFAGISATETKAVSIPTSAKEMCELVLQVPGYIFLKGSGWDPQEKVCLLGWMKVGGGYTNICYPKLDIYGYRYGVISSDQRNGGPTWYPIFKGCSGSGRFIMDSGSGGISKDGVGFEYESDTCGNGCSITRFAITGAAKSALGSLNGKVIGKAYIQIRDDDGNLVEGDFKLCFHAKGAQNPRFFRWGGGNTWSSMGGYWQGNKFCMNGTVSGNYVLVDSP